jgi:hypothetical protein
MLGGLLLISDVSGLNALIEVKDGLEFLVRLFQLNMEYLTRIRGFRAINGL